MPTAPLAERRESLWSLVASPAIWAVHFLLSYATAAVWCAKVAGTGGSLAAARIAIGVYTIVALGAIGVIAWRAVSRHRAGRAAAPPSADSPAGRHGFLGFATAALSGLSAIAIVYAAMAALIVRDCR
jgi:hypothetical protein